ncbi:MAG: hypothetical protein LBV23_11780 [Deltaproteobacteria bacterium]|nr:hypothetical protein [Deltaproteobacteria bacterium]
MEQPQHEAVGWLALPSSDFLAAGLLEAAGFLGTLLVGATFLTGAALAAVLAGAALTTLVLAAVLAGATFLGAALAGAAFFGAALAGVALAGAVLAGAAFLGAALEGAALAGADLPPGAATFLAGAFLGAVLAVGWLSVLEDLATLGEEADESAIVGPPVKKFKSIITYIF